MTAIASRAAVVEKGPSFWRDGDAVMFQFVIDGGNIIGPRPATKADCDKHMTEYMAFWHSDESTKTACFEAGLRHHAAMQARGESFVQGQTSGQPDGDAPRRKARTAKAD